MSLKRVQMSLLNDKQILKLCEQGMITPFESSLVKDGVVSYGLSSFGYDCRLANQFYVFNSQGIKYYKDYDVKEKNSGFGLEFDCVMGKQISYTIKPNQFLLAATVEKFKIPENVFGICQGKSTYARAGIFINVTPLEPGWEGELTLELFNASKRPVRLYVDEGICQINFHRADRPQVTYADRDGKYQGQVGVTFAKV